MGIANRGERARLATAATTGQGAGSVGSPVATLSPPDGTGYASDKHYTTASWQVRYGGTGTLTSGTVLLETSFDGGLTWFTLDTSSAAVQATPETRHITGKVIGRTRANIGTLVGAGATVDVLILFA